ncbi:hypothetical protein [Chryseobacterium sp.]|uniref:hypothetical protein n=1 Tax=Chryseobacterium sp. TaxID=1871047 RepID=UPI0028A21E9F|nr:hypothetical protein [Chryseobacterium sp.]
MDSNFENDKRLLDDFAGKALQALITKAPFFDAKGEFGQKIESEKLNEVVINEMTKSAYGYASWMMINREEYIEWLKGSPKYSIQDVEKRTDENMNLISKFVEHHKNETGQEIEESVILSFFQA